MSDKIEQRLSELRTMAGEFAEAFAERTYLEEFRKSKLAILMQAAEIAGFTTAAAQEREARASEEYRNLLVALRDATERSEKLRWQLEIAKMGVSVWQTQNANERAERRAYGA